jgi:hypothetical protein
MKQKSILSNSQIDDFENIVTLIKNAKERIIRSVNAELIDLYRQMARR